MRVLCYCGDKPCTQVPQNPITPTRIYRESMQGKDVAQYAYAPVDNECPAPNDFSIDITSRRGCDMDEMYQEQQRVAKEQQKFKQERQEALKRYREAKRQREQFLKSLGD